MLGCEVWILRSPVYSPRKYKVFSYYNKGYKIVFLFPQVLGVYVRKSRNFCQVDQFVHVEEACASIK